MASRCVVFTVLGVVVGLLAGVGWPRVMGHVAQAREGDPTRVDDEHTHAAEAPTSSRDEPDEHEHGHAAGEYGAGAVADEREDHAAVHLSPAAAEKLGIELATAGPGSLAREIERPGEVVLNENRVAHVVPQAPGIVREVIKNVGDRVVAGEAMAWLESAELGQAKADYLARWAEVGCCAVDFTRAQEILVNTLKLLEVLEAAPSLETLQGLNGSTTGDNGRVLVSAYAELEVARAAYARERALLQKGVSSEQDYQAAESVFKKATAQYAATRDSTEFAVRRDFLEAQRTQQVRRIELKSAERRLHVLGLDDEEIVGLEALAQDQAAPTDDEHVCTDPNCTGCAQHAVGEQKPGTPAQMDGDERLAWYALRAPFDGTVIQKHITLGERLADDADPFTIADLSSVWVDVSLYHDDLPGVGEGQQVCIFDGPGVPGVEGTVDFVAPVVAEDTRTVRARVVLPNRDGQWRPGLYVTARISIDEQHARVLIPKEAVQLVGDESVVFVPSDDGFEPRDVAVGRSSATLAEIVSGLSPGERYVAKGAFALKAEIVTSGLGAHAGHGH